MPTSSVKPKRRRAAVRRRPGRPGGADHTGAVRSALLRAARDLFAHRDFRAVSVRDIARAAHVNPAMVHYHFGDKQGLYRAMLEETLGPVLRRIQELAGDERAGLEATVPELLRAMMTLLAHEPWVPRLIVREVLAEDGPFRELFVREFASRGAGRLPILLKREIERGRVRRDFDVTLGALSFMSLALFPFLALPVAERLFGLHMSDDLVARLIEHNARLYYEGAGSGRRRQREKAA